MKCAKCQTENKDTAKNCRKCGNDLTQAPLWKPTWKWHARTLVVIYGFLIVLFFLMNHVLKPYMRQIPGDITPWLKAMPQEQAQKVG
jgi:hypothetical protein